MIPIAAQKPSLCLITAQHAAKEIQAQSAAGYRLIEAESAQARPDLLLAPYTVILCSVSGCEYCLEMQLCWFNSPFRCDCSSSALCNPSHPPYWLGKLGSRSTAADGQVLAGEGKHGVAESKDLPGALGEVKGRLLSVSPSSYACALPKTKPRLVNEDLVHQWVRSLLRETSNIQFPRGTGLAALDIGALKEDRLQLWYPLPAKEKMSLSRTCVSADGGRLRAQVCF